MLRSVTRTTPVLAAVFILVMAVSYWRMHSSNIEPVRSAHRISAGSYGSVTLHDAYPDRSRHRWSPCSVEFNSSAGIVEVYAVQVSLAGTMRHKNYIQKLVDEFAAGSVPKNAIHLSGRTGRISLKDFPESTKLPNYMLLMRSTVETEVTVVVHY